jgi:hypothetical protein
VTTALVLTNALLGLSLGWRVYLLCLARNDRPLLAVTCCIACAAVSFPGVWPAESRAVVALLGVGSARLLANALLGGVYSLMCLYLYSTAHPRRASRRARIEAVPLATVVAVITLATVAMPRGDRGHAYTAVDMGVPQAAVFFTAAGLYLVYALASAVRWTVRFARLSERPLSTGLWLTAASLAGMVATNVAWVVSDVTDWSEGHFLTDLDRCAALLLAVAVSLFVVGMSYSSTAARLRALRVWHRHLRRYRELGPLWTALYSSFPEVAFSRTPKPAWSVALSPRGVHRRYYRRVVECRDGLVRISPQLARLGIQEGTAPEVVAEELYSALRAHAAGEPVDSTPFTVAAPREDSFDADVRELVSVSEALGPHE